MTGKRISPRTTWMAGAALIALWGTSFGLSYASLGSAALPVALGIAATKAIVVLFVFMELAVEPLSIRLTIVAAASMIALLIGLMAVDVATRPSPPLLPIRAQTVDR